MTEVRAPTVEEMEVALLRLRVWIMSVAAQLESRGARDAATVCLALTDDPPEPARIWSAADRAGEDQVALAVESLRALADELQQADEVERLDGAVGALVGITDALDTRYGLTE